MAYTTKLKAQEQSLCLRKSCMPLRNQQGFSLVELLVVMVIMMFVSIAIFGMLLSNSSVQRKLENKLDAIDAIRLAAERIGKDVRMGRSFGDIYGQIVEGQNNNMIQGSSSARTFPATNDPLWSTAGRPAGWTSAWPATLSTQTLIVQIPLFDANGFPLSLPTGSGTPPIPASYGNQDDLETHVYEVIADPDITNHPGEFILQLWKFPGAAAGTTVPSGPPTGPQVLVKGIIGPTNSTGTPQIFQLVDKLNPNSAPIDPATVTNVDQAKYSGLVVNMEVRKFNSSANRAVGSEVVPIKFETYLRNNVLTTTAAN